MQKTGHKRRDRYQPYRPLVGDKSGLIFAEIAICLLIAIVMLIATQL